MYVTMAVAEEGCSDKRGFSVTEAQANPYESVSKCHHNL